MTSGRLRELAATGELRPDDFVWTEGMSKWREAGTIKGLVPGLSPRQAGSTPRSSDRLRIGTDAGGRPIEGEEPPPKQPWYCHFAVLAVATLVCFPITLILVWWKSSYTARTKWAWTGACGLMLLLIAGNDKQKREGADRGDAAVAGVERARPDDSRRPGDQPSKWGFVDPTGKMLVPCQFDEARDFDQGLAAVKRGGKWGWIERNGRTVIPFEFEDAGWFREERAPVKRGGKWGYIDRTGRLVIDCLYEELGHFEDGHARVKRDGKSLFIDLNGVPSTPLKTRPRVLIVGRGPGARFGFEDGTGRVIVNPQFDAVTDFSDVDVAVVNVGDSSGIIDERGNWVVPLQSRSWIHGLFGGGGPGLGMGAKSSEGLFGYRDIREMREGYIRATGEIAIPAQFTNATAFSEGLACVTPAVNLSELERNPEGVIRNPAFGKAGYIDKTGRFVIPPQFSGGSRFSGGLAAVKVGIEGGKWGFIDKSGGFVINPEFDEQPSDFKGEYARVKRKGQYGFIDKRGNEVVSPRFAEASDFAEGLARVRCP